MYRSPENRRGWSWWYLLLLVQFVAVLVGPAEIQLNSGAKLIFGRQINARREDGAEDNPQQLIPVEEWHADPIGFGSIIEGWPENRRRVGQQEGDTTSSRPDIAPRNSRASAGTKTHRTASWPISIPMLNENSDTSKFEPANCSCSLRMSAKPKPCTSPNSPAMIQRRRRLAPTMFSRAI